MKLYQHFIFPTNQIIFMQCYWSFSLSTASETEQLVWGQVRYMVHFFEEGSQALRSPRSLSGDFGVELCIWPHEGAKSHVHVGGEHCTLTRPFLILNSFPNHPSPYNISFYLSPLVQWPIVSPVESYCSV